MRMMCKDCIYYVPTCSAYGRCKLDAPEEWSPDIVSPYRVCPRWSDNPVDIVKIKSAIRAGEITVYQKGGRLYMENSAGERIELKPKGGEEDGTAAD